MQTRLEQTCVVQSTRGWWARGWIAKTLVQREASALCVGGELAVGRVRRGCRPPSFSVKTATCTWTPIGGRGVQLQAQPGAGSSPFDILIFN